MNMMCAARRPIFNQDHDQFRDQVRQFVLREVVPHHADWERAGQVDRDVWRKAGEIGLLCPTVAPEHGGLGVDFLFSVVVIEELCRVGATGPGFWCHSETVAPHIQNLGSDAQRQRWLPPMISGAVIGTTALAEPASGADLEGLRTTARRDGAEWVINGHKPLVNNGQLADLVVLAAQTDDATPALFLVPATTPGFRRGAPLKKLGGHARDTADLHFDDLRLPAEALLGTPGQGAVHPQTREHLAQAVACLAKAEFAFEQTLEYARTRRLFNQSLLEFENTRFVLAGIKTDLAVARSHVDDLLRQFLDNTLGDDAAAMAKLWTSEMLGRTADACLQLHGGWGYMSEFAVCQVYADARFDRFAGGSSEEIRARIGANL